MQVINIPTTEIREAVYNPRKISADKFASLVRKIEEFGLVDPLIVNKATGNTLIGGHQRLKALRQLGRDTAPCVVLDLSPDKEKLLNIALNDPSGEFDSGLLKNLLIELDDFGADLMLTGLETLQIDKLLSPPEPPEIKEWDLAQTYEPFWIVIRGPLDCLPAVKQALATADLGQCIMETSA